MVRMVKGPLIWLLLNRYLLHPHGLSEENYMKNNEEVDRSMDSMKVTDQIGAFEAHHQQCLQAGM
jgi:hypothetical protein